MSVALRSCVTVMTFLTIVWLAFAGPTTPSPAQEKRPEKTTAKPKEEPSTAGPAPPSKPATSKVEEGSFKVEVALSGVFEAQKLTELSVKPKVWSMPLAVETAIELGTPVKKGDILVEF